jgi:Family of unknown function (DUF6263)
MIPQSQRTLRRAFLLAVFLQPVQARSIKNENLGDQPMAARLRPLTILMSFTLSMIVPQGFSMAHAQQRPATPSDTSRTLVDLCPKFKPGQVTKLRLTMESTGNAPDLRALDIDGVLDEPAKSSPSKGMPEMRTWQEFVLVFKVKEPDVRPSNPTAESTKVDVTFESIKAKSTTPEGTTEFDSSKTPGPGKGNTPGGPSRPQSPADPLSQLEDPLEAALRPLVGSTLTLTIDPSGNITEVQGGQGFTSLSALSLGGISVDSGQGGGDLFKSILTPSASPGVVRVGEPWTTRGVIKTGLIGDFQMKTESCVTSHRGGRAEVAFKGTLEEGSPGGSGGMGGFQVNDSTYSGRYTWDTELGFLDSMTSEQAITLDVGEFGRMAHRQTMRAQRLR